MHKTVNDRALSSPGAIVPLSRVIVLVLSLLAAPAWAANKCTGPDGKVVLQDLPCDPSAKREELKLKEGPRLTKEEERLNAAAARGGIGVGMSATLVRRAWGDPTKINASAGAGGRTEQWIYERGFLRTQYVYLTNDVVTSWQSPSE